MSRQRSSKFLAPPSPSNQEIREISSSPGPGSIGKEDTTALPQYTFSKENLEEQPNAARALQIHLPSLPSPLAQESKASRIATQLYIISYLIFFSIFGTLARLGLSWLTFYPGAPAVTPVLWSNFGGSLILGWLKEDQRVFREEWSSHSPAPQILSTTNRSREIIITGRQHRFQDCPDAVAQHLRVKKMMPLCIGLAVGFCGSFTSFSTFMRDALLALSNDLPSPINHPYPEEIAPGGFIHSSYLDRTPNSKSKVPSTTPTVYRNAGYSLCALLAIILSTMCLSFSVFTIGKHVSTCIDRWTPTIPFTFQRRI